MKNNLSRHKDLKFKELACRANKDVGLKLRTLRNLLVLQPEILSQVLTITTNTIKNAESGLNVGTEVIGELIAFYGYDLNSFHAMKKYPTWEELAKQIEDHHKSIKSKAFNVLYERPNLIDLIEHRILKTTFFNDWVDEKGLLSYCKTAFRHEYASGTNSLNNAVKKGWLIVDENAKPKRYKKMG